MMQFLNFSAEHPLLIAFFAFVIYCCLELVVNLIARMYGLRVICKLADKDEREKALEAWMRNTKIKKPISIELTKKDR